MRASTFSSCQRRAACSAHRSRPGVHGGCVSTEVAKISRNYYNRFPSRTSVRARVTTETEAEAEVDQAVASVDLEEPDAAQATEDGSSSSLKGILLLNLGALLFGSNQVVIKMTEDVMSPPALNAARFAAAALCFSPFLASAFQNKKLRKYSLELGIWLSIGYTTQAYGLEQTSAAHGAFTGTFTVLAVPVLVGLSGRKIATRTWFAALAGIAGVSLLTTSGGDPNLGDLYCIISAILFGVHKWRSESVTQQFSSSTTQLVAMQLFVLATVSCLLCVPEVVTSVQANGVAATVGHVTDLPWPALLFMGIGTTAATLYIEMDALKQVSAPLAALIYTAEPLWGAAFAWLLLDERWGAQGWVGAAIILGASLYSQLGGDPAEKARKLEG